jgi:hypothetical protein
MKLTMMILTLLTLLSDAYAMTILDFYNEIPASIFQTYPKFAVIPSGNGYIIAETGKEAIVDIENGFLQYMQGGMVGSTTVEAAQFIAADGRNFIAVNFRETAGEGPMGGSVRSTMHIFEYRNGKMIEGPPAVFPALALTHFMNDAFPRDAKLAAATGKVFDCYFEYLLPRYGTVIIARLGLARIPNYDRPDPAGDAFFANVEKNIKFTERRIDWNAAKSVFELK